MYTKREREREIVTQAHLYLHTMNIVRLIY